MTSIPCHICKSDSLVVHQGYHSLSRVTSDCKAWKSGGNLLSCRICGCTQVACDNYWRSEISEIYRDYSIYYQGGGEEQKVFDSSTGRTLARSVWLLEKISSEISMPAKGRMLDIGCGNGRFLKAFGTSYPNWTLVGTEFNEKYASIVESLPRVERLYTGALSEVPGKFDFISLIHVLEHIEEPQRFLEIVREMLAPNGILFVELPSYENNPFELLIADHATHFSLDTACELLGSSGYAVLSRTNKWVPKELSILLGKGEKLALPNKDHSFKDVEATIAWLHHVADDCRQILKNGQVFGIFGTSIAATWLAEQIGQTPAFFVDEDLIRVGQTHLGVPILSPQNTPKNSQVYVVQPHLIALKIIERLKNSGQASYIPSPSFTV